VGSETLRTVGKILTDIVERKATDVDAPSAGDIVSKHEIESAQNLISKVRGRGRKRAHVQARGCKRANSRNIKTIKRAREK